MGRGREPICPDYLAIQRPDGPCSPPGRHSDRRPTWSWAALLAVATARPQCEPNSSTSFQGPPWIWQLRAGRTLRPGMVRRCSLTGSQGAGRASALLVNEEAGSGLRRRRAGGGGEQLSASPGSGRRLPGSRRLDDQGTASPAARLPRRSEEGRFPTAIRHGARGPGRLVTVGFPIDEGPSSTHADDVEVGATPTATLPRRRTRTATNPCDRGRPVTPSRPTASRHAAGG